MRQRGNNETFIAIFLALAFLVTNFFYVSQPMRAFAQVPGVPTDVTIPLTPGIPGASPNAPTVTYSTGLPKPSLTTADLWQVFKEGVLRAGEAAVYVVLRKAVRHAVGDGMKVVLNHLIAGGRGKGPAFETQPWDRFWEEAGNDAFGSALEGFVQGAQNEYEYEKKLSANRQRADEAISNIYTQYEKKEKEVLTCNQENCPLTDQQEYYVKSWEDNACANDPSTEACIRLRSESVIGSDSNSSLLDTSLAAFEKYKNALYSGGAEEAERLILQQENEDKTALTEKSDKNAELIAGNTGALSEATRTILSVVCMPEPDIALRIFLGLGSNIEKRKREVICPFDTLKKNWSSVVSNTGAKLDEASLQGWHALAGLVNPDTSDLGAAWKLSIGGHNVGSVAESLAEVGFLDSAVAGGLKAVSALDRTVLSPAGLVKSWADGALKSSIDEDTKLIPTGHLAADLILTIGQTILSTTLDAVREGLLNKAKIARVRGTPQERALRRINSLSNNVLYSPDSNPQFGGAEAAQAQLAKFDALDLSPPEDWFILGKLSDTTCPESMGGRKGADPDACVLDAKFQTAIKEHLTVKEAIEKGLLRRDAAFGFDKNGNDTPEWQGNLPYRSLVILRKYRVLPVSWELAALFIKENSKKEICPNYKCTLENVIAASKRANSPLYQMIDENWVLKIPPVRCVLKGYGPEIIQEVPQSTGNQPSIGYRRPDTCVDYQTCLEEDEEGKCSSGRYGTCAQEQKIIRFKGEKCDQKFVGCESFQDTQTKSTATYVITSLHGGSVCTAQNAGCAWYSKNRRISIVGNPSEQIPLRVDLGADMKAKIFTEASVQKEWSSISSSRVYLSFAAQKCDASAEGCRQVFGPAGTPAYLRLPPDSLMCLTDGIKENVVVPWYKRQDCKAYTQLCKEEYVGCQQYMPEGDTIAATGKAPGAAGDINEYRCPGACANIYNYAEQKTLFEPVGDPATTVARTVYFSAATAQKCSIADVGCEEFTNLDEVARGGEGREYFTYLQRCEKHDNPDTIPASQVFYSFVGSDTAGGQPEKYYVKGETREDGKYRPVRFDPTRACDAETVERQKYDPRIGIILCREFVDANGEVFYEWTDNLIYLTRDCTSYRRTIDGTIGAPVTYSPQYSRQCTAATANCREYRAPQAGNVRVVSYDNFEGGTIGEWKGTYRPDFNHAAVSNEGEIIGDHSLIMKKPDESFIVPTYDLIKPLAFSGDRDYQISFNVKGKAGVSVRAYLHKKNTSGGYSRFEPLSGPALLDGHWKHVSFDIPIPRTTDQFVDQEILIVATVDQDPPKNVDTVYIDDIIVKEIDGVEYLIRDTWTQNQSCFNKTSDDDPTPNFSSPAYPSCSLYRDSQGTQHAIQTFERICPNEMAGCVSTSEQVSFSAPTFSFIHRYNTRATGRERCSCDQDSTVHDCPDDNAEKGYAFVAKSVSEALECQDDYNIDGNPDSPGDIVYKQNRAFVPAKSPLFIEQPLLTTLYIIPDESKACRAEDNACTAYGSPTLLAHESANFIKRTRVDEATWKEEWNTVYVKITPEEVALGNALPTSGICRKEDLGCRAYAAGSKGNQAYFHDPGSRVCQPPEQGDGPWSYRTCQKNSSITCRQDSDCPVTDGVLEACVVKQSDICPVKFAKACPIAAAGCRQIYDPECLLNTKGSCEKNGAAVTCTSDSECDSGKKCVFDYALRTDYGRGSLGVPCIQTYYFTENFDTRSQECNGTVNVERGCLLFNDNAKRAFEYTKDGEPVGVTTVKNPLRCSCDIKPTTGDCVPPFSGTRFDPAYCYDQLGADAAPLLQKYKKNPTNLQYDSAKYYEKARQNRDVNLGDPTVSNANPDANTLIKVQQDRQCKTWLSCKAYWYDNGKQVCWKRELCQKWGTGTNCALSGDGVIGPIYDYGAFSESFMPELKSLSGIARPDYWPTKRWTDQGYVKTTGGYPLRFDKWRQKTLLSSADKTYNKLTSIINKKPSREIVNACRLYPSQDAPHSRHDFLVDACRPLSGAGTFGVYGYCLEPYPNLKKEYEPNQRVCSNSTNTPCTNDDPCPPGGSCVYKYYENYCLNWYPVDRIAGQQNLFTSALGQQALSSYTGPENVYYCNSTATKRTDLTLRFTPAPIVRADAYVRNNSWIQQLALDKGLWIIVYYFNQDYDPQSDWNNMNVKQGGTFPNDLWIYNTKHDLNPPRTDYPSFGIPANDTEKKYQKSDIASIDFYITSAVLQSPLSSNLDKFMNQFEYYPSNQGSKDGCRDCPSDHKMVYDISGGDTLRDDVPKIHIDKAANPNLLLVEGWKLNLVEQNKFWHTPFGSGDDDKDGSFKNKSFYQKIVDFKRRYDDGAQDQSCPHMDPGEVIFALQPSFGGQNSTMHQWVWRVCRGTIPAEKSISNQIDESIFFSTFAVDFQLTPLPVDEKSMTYAYQETYCNQYIQTVLNGNAVPRSSLQSFDMGKEGAVSLPEGATVGQEIQPVVYKRESLGWQYCDDEKLKILHENGLAEGTMITVPDELGGTLDFNTLTCSTTPSFSPRPFSGCGAERFFCNRIDGKGADGPNIKVTRNQIRENTPFRKFYNTFGFAPSTGLNWRWFAAWDFNEKKAIAKGSTGGAVFMQNFWNTTTNAANENNRKPRIYSRSEDTSDKDKFAVRVNTTDDKDTDKDTDDPSPIVDIRFYTWAYRRSTSTSDEDQQPIRRIAIKWQAQESGEENQDILEVFNSSVDGRGIAKTFGKAPGSPPSSDPYDSAGVDSYRGHGPYYYTYDGSLKDKKICVIVEDNWGGRSETCGTFGEDNKISEWNFQ